MMFGLNFSSLANIVATSDEAVERAATIMTFTCFL
jgi:hypothetical protein